MSGSSRLALLERSVSEQSREGCVSPPSRKTQPSLDLLSAAQSVSVHFSPHKTSNKAARFVSQAYALGDKVWR